MTATFLLPLAQGACTAVGGDVVKDAFGVVAMVAMTPLITLQVLGLIYKIKSNKRKKWQNSHSCRQRMCLPGMRMMQL